jgi:poly-gamma-glutamate synthesis protein (capsule biosynthesis protein)
MRAISRDGAVLGAVPASAVTPRVRVVLVDGVNPLRDPASYPLTTPDDAAPAVTTATVVGDVMLARRVGARMAARGDFAAALRPTAARLASADLTVGNLEGTLSRLGRPRQGGDSFGADPRVRQGLRRAGFDVLSLANNHTGDYGLPSLVETVRRVRAAGIVPVGAGADLAEARQPAVVERNGIRFGVVAFDAIGETPAARAGRPGAFRLRMQPRTGPLVPGDLNRVLDTVRDLRSRVDVLMVLPHWGTQYTTRTVADQRRVGRALVGAGADIVVGGHPHWVQGIELHRGAPIAYSLGNYVFDMDFSRQTQEGAFLELVFWGAQLKAVDVVPVRIGADFAPRVATGRAGQAILERIWDASGRPLSGTHRDRS